MAQPYAYPMKQVLADVLITSLTAGATHTTPISGSSSTSDTSGTSQITKIGSQNVINSTALSGLFGDATDLILVPPIASDNTFPDVLVWPYLDGIDLGDRMTIDASANGNMFPNIANTVGQRHVSFGMMYREAVRKGVRNLPMVATGLKYSRQLQWRVTSVAGWATTDQPLRIIALGDLLDAQALTTVAAAGYNGSFSDSVPGFPAFAGNHQLPGGQLTAGTWTALSGGNAQGATKIHRFFRTSSNAVATSGSGIFVMSNQTAVQGASGNVASDVQDLGFDYVDGTKYLRFLEAGIRPGANNALWGLKVNDTILPAGQGIVATAGVNLWPYGNVQPQLPGSDLYYALPKNPFPVAAYRNKLAFFIQADGTAVATGDTSIAVGGVLVETGLAA